MEKKKPPTRFFENDPISRARFFEANSVRSSKIQETLKFYREHLNKEYCSLSQEVTNIHILWLLCVGSGFGTLISGVALMLYGEIAQNGVFLISTVLVYFIQRVFYIR